MESFSLRQLAHSQCTVTRGIKNWEQEQGEGAKSPRKPPKNQKLDLVGCGDGKKSKRGAQFWGENDQYQAMDRQEPGKTFSDRSGVKIKLFQPQQQMGRKKGKRGMWWEPTILLNTFKKTHE